MTDKELHKLKRSELLELLIYMRDELDRLEAENEKLRNQKGGISDDHALLQQIWESVCQKKQNQPSRSKKSKRGAK